MTLVVGYDPHPAGRAALVFAGELAGTPNVPLFTPSTLATKRPAWQRIRPSSPTEIPLTSSDAFGSAHVQWTYHRLAGDPMTVLLDTADPHGASMLILGSPEQGLGAAVGHFITGNVARNVLRGSTRPVVVVPEFGAPPR